MKKWNKEFDVEEIETTCFSLYILDDLCYDNIESCLNSEGKFVFTDAQMQEHSLNQSCYLRIDEVGNDTSAIVLNEDVTFELGESMFPMKGMFLVTDSGFVMGYSINTYSVNVTNQMIFKKDLIFWNIVEGAINE